VRRDRYRVERAFEDGKGECGLADYQALGWRSWHHHVTIVMLAMLSSSNTVRLTSRASNC
jgi:SRSO17 transposase